MNHGNLGSPTLLSSSPIGINAAQQAFIKALKNLEIGDEIHLNIKETGALLRIAGMGNKDRNRFRFLTREEIKLIGLLMPEWLQLWPDYIREIHLMLSRMDQYRKMDPLLGRPFVTECLTMSVGKLYCLRYLERRGIETISTSDLRLFFMDYSMHEWFVKHIETKIYLGEKQCEDQIAVRSVIVMLELYRDELLSPPRFDAKQPIYEFNVSEPDINDFGWLDGDEYSIPESESEMCDVTYHENILGFNSVVDWYITVRPQIDDNRRKRGWPYLEKLSRNWKKKQDQRDLLCDIVATYPAWGRVGGGAENGGMSRLSIESTYRVVELTSPQDLLQESIVMNHCVVTYIGRCLSGFSRIFSYRDAKNGHSVATGELAVKAGHWCLVQLKGKHNQELMPRTRDPSTLLAIATAALVKEVH